MFEPLPSPAEMAAWDAAAVAEFGLRPEVLMENASRAALEVLIQECGAPRGKRVMLLAGGGGNGGDALALARPLHDQGALVELWLAAPSSKFKGATRYNYQLARKYGLKMRALRPGQFPDLRDFDILVDGLYGTGFRGPLRDEAALWIGRINARPKACFVLSLDIPSGLDGLSGEASPLAVRADATISFEAAKCGLAEPAAAPYLGRLSVRKIGIPSAIKEKYPASRMLLTAKLKSLYPLPQPDLHKCRAGRVLVVGGSSGLSGAPLLCGLAALRCGAGLVTLACPGGLESIVKAGRPEIMTLPLGEGNAWSPQFIGPIRESLARFDAVVVGPGLGRSREAGLLVESLLELDLPSVWDADALFALAERPKLQKRLPQGAILTPHPGEMARLCGVSIQEIAADRAGFASALAKKTGACVILKGAASLIAAAPGQSPQLCLSPFSAPNLAVGGSGDVLSGILGSLLAHQLSPLQAAALGVYWHALAGRKLAEIYPLRGNLAGEIADILPFTLKEWTI